MVFKLFWQWPNYEVTFYIRTQCNVYTQKCIYVLVWNFSVCINWCSMKIYFPLVVNWLFSIPFLIASFFLFSSSPKDIFSLLLEKEDEREKHRCEREASTGCLPLMSRPGVVRTQTWTRDQKSNPLPRCVPWSGNEPANFWFIGQCSNQLKHTSQG